MNFVGTTSTSGDGRDIDSIFIDSTVGRASRAGMPTAGRRSPHVKQVANP